MNEKTPDDLGELFEGSKSALCGDIHVAAERGPLTTNACFPKGIGPNGYPVGFTSMGNFAEWIPDDGPLENKYPITILRSYTTIWAAFEELRDKVLWGRLKNIVATAEQRKIPPERLTGVLTQIKDLERKYGMDDLGGDEFDSGMRAGRMSALAWVLGQEWDDSLYA